MSDAAAWQNDNARYLSAALAWLRALLERLAKNDRQQATEVLPPPPAQPPSEGHAEGRPFWRRFRGDAPQLASAPEPLLLPQGKGSGDLGERVSRAFAEMTAAAQTTPPPALLLLSQRLGLSPFERDLLLLCAAMELDTGIAGLCAAAQGDANRPYPTFALALALFDKPSWDALSPEGRLRYWRLIEIVQQGGQPLTVSPLRADERIVSYLKCLNYLDDRLGPLLTPLEMPSAEEQLPPSQQEAAARITGYLNPLTGGQTLPIVQLLGSDAASKVLIAVHAAAELGLQVYRLPAALLPAQVERIGNTEPLVAARELAVALGALSRRTRL